jgi:hypothetical protein
VPDPNEYAAMKVLLGVVLAASLVGTIGCGEVKGSGPSDAAELDAPVTPPIDAMIDGRVALAKFDIAYVDKFTFAWNFGGTGLRAFAAVANMGTMPMNLNKITIVSVTDDQPTIDTTFGVEPSDTPLAPGTAAGLLGRSAIARIYETGLMTEENNDEKLVFVMAFPNFNDSFVGKTVAVRATLRIEDAELVLPISVTFVASQVTLSDSAARLSSN